MLYWIVKSVWQDSNFVDDRTSFVWLGLDGPNFLHRALSSRISNHFFSQKLSNRSRSGVSENINFAGSFYFQLCTNVMINVMLYGQNMRQYITNIFIILGRHLSLKYTWTMFNFYATQNIFDTSYLACMLVYQQIQVAYVMG